MFTIAITERGGQPVFQQFDQAEVSIGRVSGNDIVLGKSNVSKRHARILNNQGLFVVVDTKSTNGTYVNGHRIDAPYDLKSGDVITIGEYTLEIKSDAHTVDEQPFQAGITGTGEANNEPITQPPTTGSGEKPSFGDDPSPEDIAFALSHFDVPESDLAAEPNLMGPDDEVPESAAPPSATTVAAHAIMPLEDEGQPQAETPPPVAAVPIARIKPVTIAPNMLATASADAESKDAPPPAHGAPHAAQSVIVTPTEGALSIAQVAVMARDQLRERLSIMAPATQALANRHNRQKILACVRELVAQLEIEGKLEPVEQPEALLRDVLHDALHMDPLERLLWDDTVDGIVIHGPDHIQVTRRGAIETTSLRYEDANALQHTLNHLLAHHAVDLHASCNASVQLEDGSHLNVITPPIAIRGPLVTLFKKMAQSGAMALSTLVSTDFLSAEMAQFLTVCVLGRKNIIISGGTNADTSVLLQALMHLIPSNESAIWLSQPTDPVLSDLPHVAQLQAPPLSTAHRAAWLHTAHAMHPHRLIVSDCTGAETCALLTAMASDGEGSIGTLQAQAPRDVLNRLETWALLGDATLSPAAARQLVAAAVDVVVHVMHFTDGSQRIVRIAEVLPSDDEQNELQDIFAFRHRGFSQAGKVQGSFKATGTTPKFYQILKATGLDTDLAIFKTP